MTMYPPASTTSSDVKGIVVGAIKKIKIKPKPTTMSMGGQK